MTMLAGILGKSRGSTDERMYNSLVKELKSLVDHADCASAEAASIKISKLWLNHSRTQGIYQDADSASWLACVGNPFSSKYRGLGGADFGRALLNDYLKNGIVAVTKLNAPFVVFIYDGREQELVIVTDRLGLQHVYFAELEDCYLFSTSSLALASAIRPRLDYRAVASFFMASYIMGPGSFFEGINKLDAATITRFTDGRLRTQKYWEPGRVDKNHATIGEYAGVLAQVCKKAVCDRLGDDGRTSVELTSGIDSRINLACAAASGKDFHAWTIGQNKSPEVIVAERLRRVRGFKHHVLSAAHELPETFMDDLELICRLTDCDYNCLNLISSPSCNRQSASIRDASMSGLAGEILRGPYYLYYKGVPNRAGPVNYDRMLKFKMVKNVCPERSVFSNKFPADYDRILRGLLDGYFEPNRSMPLRWQLDYYYFAASVQRFVGRSCSFNNYFYRLDVPWFDNDVVELSFRVPHRYKMNSRLVRHTMALCDPQYSEVALENGLPARPLTTRDTALLAGYYTRFGKRVCRRIITGLTGRSRATPDNAGVYGTVTRILKSDRVLKLLDHQNMASAFLYDPDRLRKYRERAVANDFKDRTQVGLMLTFELMCRRLGSSLKTA